MITCPASPKASVTIAKVIPVVRSEAIPTSIANSAVTATATNIAMNHGATSLFISMQVMYIPVPK